MRLRLSEYGKKFSILPCVMQVDDADGTRRASGDGAWSDRARQILLGRRWHSQSKIANASVHQAIDRKNR
ncbi:hypothetical protein EOE48_13715 [Methylobacterium oryzihabitans]|uniref:Uncharacterized protein n=1 Tax=Methylobacterium oryzihabitans TaxID=2499852 RepID=A0A437P5B4_9HYPH|nr:hypothetical protein EOE48_13715 [Methylobacterium oryzihabitans]